MRLVHLWSPLLGVALAAFAAAPAGAQSSPVRLNEFLAGPARDWDGGGALSTRDDEWVEVVNTGAAPADLAGLLLTDGDRLPRFAFTGSLDPGARRLVFGGEAYDWERATGHPAFGLALANGGDSVMLWQVVGPDTLLLDAYTYKSHEGASDRAVGRGSDGAAAWMLFDALNPYTGTTPPTGTGCVPSPGAPNICGATPTRRVSWGEVKTIYR